MSSSEQSTPAILSAPKQAHYADHVGAEPAEDAVRAALTGSSQRLEIGAQLRELPLSSAFFSEIESKFRTAGASTRRVRHP